MLLNQRALAQRLEYADACHSASYAQMMPKIVPDVVTDVLPIAGGFASYCGAGMPMNRVIGLGMHDPVSQSLVDDLQEFYAQYNAIPMIDFCPYADPTFIEQVGIHRYGLLKHYQVYVRALPADDFQPTISHGVSIEQAHDEALWVKTVAQGFTERDIVPDDVMSNVLSHIAFQRQDTHCFQAIVDGEPAGGGALSVREHGVAILFSTSTRPAYRQRGVQAALMQARLELAYHLGCDLIMVLAIAGSASERNIQRAGFQLAYTKVVLGKDL